MLCRRHPHQVEGIQAIGLGAPRASIHLDAGRIDDPVEHLALPSLETGATSRWARHSGQHIERADHAPCATDAVHLRLHPPGPAVQIRGNQNAFEFALATVRSLVETAVLPVMSAVVPSLNVPVTTIWLVWPTDASVTFAPLIVADTRVGVAEVQAPGGRRKLTGTLTPFPRGRTRATTCRCRSAR
jgi:hypothetical protein